MRSWNACASTPQVARHLDQPAAKSRQLAFGTRDQCSASSSASQTRIDHERRDAPDRARAVEYAHLTEGDEPDEDAGGSLGHECATFRRLPLGPPLPDVGDGRRVAYRREQPRQLASVGAKRVANERQPAGAVDHRSVI